MTVDHWQQLVMNAACEAVKRDPEQLRLVATMLWEHEQAKQALRAKGYGCTGMGLLVTIEQEVPQA